MANPAATETFGFGEDGLKGLSLHLLLSELQYEKVYQAGDLKASAGTAVASTPK